MKMTGSTEATISNTTVFFPGNLSDARPGTLPSPPFHDIPGVHNFRDIGGYRSTVLSASSTPKIVRRGLVFRSADPSSVTTEGVVALNCLGIKKVYDLRSNPEVANPSKVKEWDGAERVFLPVFLDEDYSPEAIALRCKSYASEGCEGFVQAYNLILNASTSSANPFKPLVTLLDHLTTPLLASTSSAAELPAGGAHSSALQPLPDPFLLHCTAGKDRTGVLCAIILSLLGVPDHLVAEEYRLTDIGLRPLWHLLIHKLVTDSPLKGNKEGAERMGSSRKENMMAFLEGVRREYGSVEGMVELRCAEDFGGREGVTMVLEKLRDILLVDDGATGADGREH